GRRGRRAELPHQLERVRARVALAEKEDDLAVLTSAELDTHLQRGARIESGAEGAGQIAPPQRGWMPDGAIASEELQPIPGGRGQRGGMGEGDSPAERLVVRVLSQHGRRRRIERGRDVDALSGARRA